MINKRTKEEKGITLVALVITIIVMLILVGVTVNVALNGGLFSTAKKAVGDTENEIKVEQKLSDGRVRIGDLWYASIEDYLKGNPIEQGTTNVGGEFAFTTENIQRTFASKLAERGINYNVSQDSWVDPLGGHKYWGGVADLSVGADVMVQKGESR